MNRAPSASDGCVCQPDATFSIRLFLNENLGKFFADPASRFLTVAVRLVLGRHVPMSPCPFLFGSPATKAIGQGLSLTSVSAVGTWVVD